MGAKTNAIRLVERAKIICREAFYDYDVNDLSGNHAAEAIGFPPEQVYKTLVAKGSRTGINVFCIPVCAELDLKKAAKVAGDKSRRIVCRPQNHADPCRLVSDVQIMFERQVEPIVIMKRPRLIRRIALIRPAFKQGAESTDRRRERFPVGRRVFGRKLPWLTSERPSIR